MCVWMSGTCVCVGSGCVSSVCVGDWVGECVVCVWMSGTCVCVGVCLRGLTGKIKFLSSGR